MIANKVDDFVNGSNTVLALVEATHFIALDDPEETLVLEEKRSVIDGFDASGYRFEL